MLTATIENMRRLESEGKRGVFAYSPDTGERYSATSGDYFWLPEGEALKDENGGLMILATESVSINPA